MPFNGSGVFNRVYNWVTDRNNGINILASRVDTEDDGFASGLTLCITKDGQSTPTADIGFGGFKVKNIGSATLTSDAVNAGQIQNGLLTYYTDTGVADAYIITPSPAVSSYAIGQSWRVKIANTNATTTPTINVNGLGAKTIILRDGTVPAIGAIITGAILQFDYDGTNMQVTPANIASFNPAAVAITGGTITGVTLNNSIIGGTTRAAGSFTTLDANSTLNITGTSTLGTVNSGALTITTNSAGNATETLKLVNNSSSANTAVQLEFNPSATNNQYYTIRANNDGSNNINMDFYSVTAGSGTLRARLPFAGGLTVGSTTTGTPTDGQVNATAYLINGVALSTTFNLLSTQIASNSAQLDFNSVITSAYDYYIFIHQDIRPATDGVIFQMLMSTNNGSTYLSSYDSVMRGFTSAAAITAAFAAAAATIDITPADVGNATGSCITGKTELFSPNGTVRGKSVENAVNYKNSTGTLHTIIDSTGWETATTAITAVRFKMSAGNITSGKIYCYGVKNT